MLRRAGRTGARPGPALTGPAPPPTSRLRPSSPTADEPSADEPDADQDPVDSAETVAKTASSSLTSVRLGRAPLIDFTSSPPT